MSPLKNTIVSILNYSVEVKKENIFEPVTVIVPNIDISYSFYKVIKEKNLTLMNFRIETLRQFVYRATEPLVLSQNKGILSEFDVHFIIQKILSEFPLNHYSAARKFSSYTSYFQRLFDEIQLNISLSELENFVSIENNNKLKELHAIYRNFIIAKNGRWSYSDLCLNFSQIKENVILFPEQIQNLARFELDLLSKCKTIKSDFKLDNNFNHSIITFTNPLYNSEEIRSIFREILSKQIPFEDVALIAPKEYFNLILTEAKNYSIPTRCELSDEILLQCFIFLSILDILETDFSFPSLSLYFRLKKQFSCLKHLLKLNVAIGKKTLENSMIEYLKINEDSQSLKTLSNTLNNLFKASDLKDTPHELGTLLVENFITDSFEKNVIINLLEIIQKAEPNIKYEKWLDFIQKQIPKIHRTQSKNENGLLVTDNALPGIYSYIFFAGLKDSTFPIRHRESPLLSDREKSFLNEKTGAKFSLASENNLKEHNKIILSMYCAEKSWTGSFPYQDIINGNQEFPSFSLISFLIEKQNSFLLKNLNEYIQKLRQNIGPVSEKQIFTLNELFLFFLNSKDNTTKDKFILHILNNRPFANLHHLSELSFWGMKFDNRSGIITELYKNRKITQQYFSVTSDLQTFMNCPYQWFLKRELRLKSIEEPVPIENFDFMKIGSIIHEVLEKFMQEVSTTDKLNRSRLLEVFEEMISMETDRSGSVHTFFLNKSKLDMIDMLDNFLKHEETIVIENPQRTAKIFELSFGGRDGDVKPAIKLQIGSLTILLTGKIDRIDFESDNVYILDYKTGKAGNYNPEIFNGGTHLQPSLYAYAVKQLIGKENQITNIYTGYLSLKENFTEKIILETPQREELLLKYINFIIGTIDKGIFFPSGNCDYCDYTSICGNAIAISSEKKFKQMKNSQDVQSVVESYKELSDVE